MQEKRRELIIASNNQGKLQEIRRMLEQDYLLITLKESGITAELPEPFDTFRENAWSKAHYVYEHTGKGCFAEDSGLVVPALNGAPGVYSARYAGPAANDQQNNRKLLKALSNIQDKRAYYQSVICLITKEGIHYFEGQCRGSVTLQPRGAWGFGYDPLFIPDGSRETFAEIDPDLKNRISHRGKSIRLLAAFLNSEAYKRP